MPFIENFQEFKERMGCDCVRTEKGWIFENGGESDTQIHHDPPDDPAALLTRQVKFLRIKTRKAEEEFQQWQSNIVTQADYARHGAGPPPVEDELRVLERLRDIVFRLREKVDHAESTLYDLQGPSMSDRYREQRDKERAAANEIQQRAMEIQI